MKRIAALTVLVGLALSGCGDDGADVAQEATPAPASSTPSSATTDAVTEGVEGQTLKTADDLEVNGRSVEERFSLRVANVRAAKQPDDPYKLYRPGDGNRWITARVTVRQTGKTSAGPLVEQFVAEDREGNTFAATQTHNFPGTLTPSSNEVKLSPGQQRSGVIAFAVPSGRRIVSVRFADAGYGPNPDSAVWKLSTPVG